MTPFNVALYEVCSVIISQAAIASKDILNKESIYDEQY